MMRESRSHSFPSDVGTHVVLSALLPLEKGWLLAYIQ